MDMKMIKMKMKMLMMMMKVGDDDGYLSIVKEVMTCNVSPVAMFPLTPLY